MVVKAISDHPGMELLFGEKVKGRGLGTQLWEAPCVTGKKKRDTCKADRERAEEKSREAGGKQWACWNTETKY